MDKIFHSNLIRGEDDIEIMVNDNNLRCRILIRHKGIIHKEMTINVNFFKFIDFYENYCIEKGIIFDT